MSIPSSPALSTATAVAADGISKRYGDGPSAVDALREVSLAVAAGSFTAVMGPSGSGKSTLLHCLSGLDGVTGGKIFLGDVEITSLRERDLTQLRRERIGFVFQAFNLLPSLSARENILLPLELAGNRPDPDRFSSVTTLLGLGDRLEHRPGELSGGQIQRVAIARALITDPDVIFADEPTGNLDRRSGTELLGLLRRCVSEFEQTVIMVTHDPAAAAHADRVMFLADGRTAGELVEPDLASILAQLDVLDSGGAGR